MVMDMVHHNPGEALTQSQYLEPEYLAKVGYGAKVFFLFDAAQFGIDWHDYDSSIFPTGSEDERWVREKEISITNGYNKAKQAGLDVYCMLDMIVLPKALVDKYKSRIVDNEGKIDISLPQTQECIRYLIRSMFKSFPQLDGLIIRTGETYLHDAPYHVGNHPVRRGMHDHITLINILNEEVCSRLNKKLIYRTWDMGKLHSLAHHYQSVADSIAPNDNLYFSIKHTATDFWRMGLTKDSIDYSTFDTYWIDESDKYGVPFNPCLGIGHHKQIVEVQCQREYEGKGAHPNYIANGVINGFSELSGSSKPYCLSHLVGNDTYSGIWTWSRGGGWGGPYITNEFWIDLNSRVMALWASNPERSEEECFYEVASTMGIAANDLERFRHLCLLSADGVLKGQYSAYGNMYVNWTRDDSMTGDAFTNKYLEKIINDGCIEKYITEKREAVEIWREIESIARSISFTSPEIGEFVVVSSTYGRIKYEILSTAWRIMLNGKNAELTGKPYDATEMKSDIATYDKLWAEWHQLKKEHNCCASLYHPTGQFFGHEVGLNSTIDKYRE